MKNTAGANYVLFVRFDAIISSIIEWNFVHFVRSLSPSVSLCCVQRDRIFFLTSTQLKGMRCRS